MALPTIPVCPAMKIFVIFEINIKTLSQNDFFGSILFIYSQFKNFIENIF